MKKKSIALALVCVTNAWSYSDTMEGIEVSHVKETERSEDRIITGEEIQRSQARDLRELFQRTESLSVGGGAPTSQKVYIRGVEDINLNIQVDGAQQGSYLFHHQGNLFMESEFVKSVEVRPGTARADDGFGALGGSLLVKTKNVFDFAIPEDRHGGMAKATYFTNQRYLRPVISLYSMPTNNIGILFTGSYQDGNAYTDGRGETVQGTADQQVSSLVKVSGKGERHSFDIGYERLVDEGLRAPRQNFGWDPTADVLSRQESRRDTVTLNGKYSLHETFGNLEGNLYHTSSELRRERPNQSDSATDGVGIGGTIANVIETQSTRVKFGADYVRNSSDAPNGDESEINRGLFLQARPTLGNKVTLDAGVRYDMHDFEAGNGKDFSNNQLSPNARIEVCPLEGLCLFTGYSEAFRGIRPAEALLINGSLNYADNIDPETSVSRELGGSWGRGGHAFRLTFYKRDITNLIVIDRAANIRKNSGDLRTQGYEASYDYTTAQKINLRVGYAQVRPTLNGGNLSNQSMGIGTTLGDTWSASVSGVLERIGVAMGATARLVERVNTSVIDKPSYDLYDIWAEYHPRNLPAWKFSFYVANLFNETYVDHATFFSSGGREQLYNPGRDFRFSATYSF